MVITIGGEKAVERGQTPFVTELFSKLKNILKIPQVKKRQSRARFGSTDTKIGTTQRRFAWVLSKDDTQVCEEKAECSFGWI